MIIYIDILCRFDENLSAFCVLFYDFIKLYLMIVISDNNLKMANNFNFSVGRKINRYVCCNFNW